jgi:hypothetical protein
MRHARIRARLLAALDDPDHSWRRPPPWPSKTSLDTPGFQCLHPTGRSEATGPGYGGHGSNRPTGTRSKRPSFSAEPHDHDEVRRAAVALGRIGSPALAVPSAATCRERENNPYPEWRKQHQGDGAMFNSLSPANPRTLQAATRALGYLPDAEAVPLLAETARQHSTRPRAICSSPKPPSKPSAASATPPAETALLELFAQLPELPESHPLVRRSRRPHRLPRRAGALSHHRSPGRPRNHPSHRHRAPPHPLPADRYRPRPVPCERRLRDLDRPRHPPQRRRSGRGGNLPCHPRRRRRGANGPNRPGHCRHSRSLGRQTRSRKPRRPDTFTGLPRPALCAPPPCRFRALPKPNQRHSPRLR